MITKEELEKKLNANPLVVARLETLKEAEKINPDFKSPHIMGGFLRNIALDLEPNDCDVVFKGTRLNQEGITESVKEAERRLKIPPYPDWDFENILATGMSDDFYENAVGKLSNHTDYLTVLLMDVDGKLYLGEDKTLTDIENKVYDLRFSGIEIWAQHRGKGRSYLSCLVGDLTRGLYLCKSLNLTPSAIVTFLLGNYDHFFSQLSPDDQKGRMDYWLRKTKADPKFQEILTHYGISSLKTPTS